MQIHEVKRWWKYWFTYSSSSKFLSAAWTFTFGSFFHCSSHHVGDILH